jgi:hypothetical protein
MIQAIVVISVIAVCITVLWIAFRNGWMQEIIKCMCGRGRKKETPAVKKRQRGSTTSDQEEKISAPRKKKLSLSATDAERQRGELLTSRAKERAVPAPQGGGITAATRESEPRIQAYHSDPDSLRSLHSPVLLSNPLAWNLPAPLPPTLPESAAPGDSTQADEVEDVTAVDIKPKKYIPSSIS